MAKRPANATKAAERWLSAEGFAELHDVDVQTVYRWCKSGMPARMRKGRREVPEVAASAWIVQQGKTKKPGRPRQHDSADLAEARCRKELALAETYELRLEKERGTVIDAAEAESEWTRQILFVRQKVMGLAATLSAPLASMSNAVEVQTFLDARFRDVFDQISREDPDDAGAGEPGP